MTHSGTDSGSEDAAQPGGETADDALQRVADTYRAAVRAVGVPGGLDELPIDGYDRTGVPTIATGVPVELPAGRVTVHGVGYGVSRAAAAVGALGELAEEAMWATAAAALRPRRASYAELVRERGAAGVADPVTLTLPAGSDHAAERPLDWVPVRRWRTGEDVLVPVEFVAATGDALPLDAPPGGWLITAITNGLGAGDTVERAVGHGLLELLQRDGDTVSFRALDQGVVVDDAGLSDPVTRALLERMRGAGIDVTVKLASTEFVCVVYCVGRDEEPGTSPLAVSAIGEAAATDRELAVRKAVLEFAASRARRVFSFGSLEAVRARHPDYLARELAVPLGEQEPRALAAMTEWTAMSAAELSSRLDATLFSRRAVVPLTELPTSFVHGPVEVLDVLLDRLADFDVLVATTEREGATVAKVVVPGLEVETLSYLRIGERVLRRLLERGSPLVGLGPARGSRLPVRLTAESTERIGGPAWLDRDAVDALVGPLYPLYREPSRHAVQRLAAGL